MKKFDDFFFDSFLIEKQFNEWLDQKTISGYIRSFYMLINSNTIIYDDYNTYTEINFKKFLSENFIKNNWCSSTYNFYRKIYSTYCRYLQKQKVLLQNPFLEIKKMREEKKMFKYFDNEQVKLILSLLNKINDPNTFLWLRNITIIKTLLYTGIRRQELLNLKLTDIKLNDWFIIIKQGKWNKDRIIPIIKQLKFILLKYLNLLEFYFKENVYLFPSKNKNKLTPKRLISSVLDKLNAKLNFHLTFHKFRHTFATELVRNNVDIFNIATILWHSKIETTKIYLNADVSRIREQISWLDLYF